MINFGTTIGYSPFWIQRAWVKPESELLRNGTGKDRQLVGLESIGVPQLEESTTQSVSAVMCLHVAQVRRETRDHVRDGSEGADMLRPDRIIGVFESVSAHVLTEREQRKQHRRKTKKFFHKLFPAGVSASGSFPPSRTVTTKRHLAVVNVTDAA